MPDHVRAGAVAVLIFVGLFIVAQSLLTAWAARQLDTLAPTGEDEVVKGVYLNRLALSQPDRLVAMGSSELTFQDHYHAVRLLHDKPTGFNMHVIGAGYRQSIHNFLVLSSLGEQLKGKRLVLFVSPTWFTPDISERAYRRHCSAIQAYEFAYGSALSPELKQRGARRLLALKGPVLEDALLHTTLHALAEGGTWGRVRYLAAWPLGRSAQLYYRFKDRWDVARFSASKRNKPYKATRVEGALNWERLTRAAEQEATERSTNNRFGMANEFYSRYVGPKLAELQNSAAGETWLKSTEYADLELVLATLKELKAQPLFVSLPVMGSYYDFKGHPAADRQAYYAKVRTIIEDAGFPVVDYGPQENEPGFMIDPWHQGWKGAVGVAQTLDGFYHGRLPESRR